MVVIVSGMRFRRLGDSGLVVSVVGIGCNNFGSRIDAQRTDEVVHAALDAGVNLFDTADVYGSPIGRSEKLLGTALGRRRDKAIIATKFGSDLGGALGPDWGARGSRRYILQAVEASLKRLNTDYIDLYQIHWPDPKTPVEETLETLDDLVHEGKVRYIGCSNYSGWQVADAAWIAKTRNLTPFVSAQNQYSLLNRDVERDLVSACERFGLGMLPYFPLASGLLTGKYRRGETPPSGTRLSSERHGQLLQDAPWDTIERLMAYAEKRGRTMLDVAIGGLAAQSVVASVIAGATSAEQVHANVAAGQWEPTPEDLAELDEITRS
jgi:aryl-alcohol dehydrogenase-like predicted oxidoreductase